jgi:hypothetical protein
MLQCEECVISFLCVSSRRNCINICKCHDFNGFKLTELQNLTLVSRRLKTKINLRSFVDREYLH